MVVFRRALIAGVGVLALAGSVALGFFHADASAAPSPEQNTVQTQMIAQSETKAAATAPKLTGAQVIARALTWHPHTSQRVSYSQYETHGGYRTDCSGYASMALSLAKPGPITVNLATNTYTTRISMSQLKKGDLVIDATGDHNSRHVVIFEKWTNSKHTAYWAFEQRGSYGTDHRVRTYGLSKGSQYHAYKPKNLV